MNASNKDGWLFVCPLAGVLGVLVLFALVLPHWIDDSDERANFGDSFGAMNALFSGCAFAGVIYAIILQRRDLALQRSEMEMSRQELINQNELIAKQLTAMQKVFVRSEPSRSDKLLAREGHSRSEAVGATEPCQ